MANQINTIMGILKNASRRPKTSYNIMIELEDHNIFITQRHVEVVLAKLKKDGLASFEKLNCECCGAKRACYRLTEDGMIKLRNIT